MDHPYVLAALLGLVEGFTEFLPVSSTGHLILFVDLLKFKAPEGRAFEVMVQLGAILAVLVAYRVKIFTLLRAAPREPTARRFMAALAIGVIPALIMGALFGETVKSVLFNPTVVAIALILGGVVLLALEHYRPAPEIMVMEDISPFRAFLIGCGQCLALIPGVSRSGATIAGAMVMKIDRPAAAEFSFFLALPTMAAAFAYQALKLGGSLHGEDVILIAIGFVTAFLAALVVVKSFVAVVSRLGFAPFAYYRITLGTLVLALLSMQG